MTTKRPRDRKRAVEILLSRLRARRVAARGMTLVEILIVLAIIGMIAGGVAVVAVPKFNQAKVDSAVKNMRIIHTAAEMYRSSNAGECPSVATLKKTKEISATSDSKDSWGNPYKIYCDEDEVRIVSSGPDGKENTPDDLSMPENRAGEEE